MPQILTDNKNLASYLQLVIDGQNVVPFNARSAKELHEHLMAVEPFLEAPAASDGEAWVNLFAKYMRHVASAEGDIDLTPADAWTEGDKLLLQAVAEKASLYEPK